MQTKKFRFEFNFQNGRRRKFFLFFFFTFICGFFSASGSDVFITLMVLVDKIKKFVGRGKGGEEGGEKSFQFVLLKKTVFKD